MLNTSLKLKENGEVTEQQYKGITRGLEKQAEDFKRRARQVDGKIHKGFFEELELQSTKQREISFSQKGNHT